MKHIFLIAALLSMVAKAEITSFSSMTTDVQTFEPQTVAEETATESNRNYYEELKNLYSKGTLAKLSDLKGWTSGRCVEIQTPTVLVPVLLTSGIVRLKLGDDNGGPLLQPEFKDLQITEYIVHSHGAPADYFDELTDYEHQEISQLLRNSAERFHNKSQKDSFSVDEQELVQMGTITLNDYQNKYRYTYKKYQNYILSKLNVIRTVYNNETKQYEQKNSVTKYCYLFQKIKD